LSQEACVNQKLGIAHGFVVLHFSYADSLSFPS